MKKFIIFIVFMLSALFFKDTMAGSIETGNPERERSSKEAFSESVLNKYTKIQDFYAEEKYSEARAALVALKDKRMNNFETAKVHEMLGWIESTEGNYKEAAKQYQIALDSDALSNRAQFSLMLQMAQIMIGDGKYQQGLDALHKYYKVTDTIHDSTFALEANAYSRLEDYKTAIPILKKAIAIADKPKEDWTYLLYSLHMQLSQFNEASKVLETLIVMNPDKKDYWKRLSDIYFTLKKDDKALAVLVLADKNGLLNEEKERIQLFKMYHYLGVPYKAGNVLEQGLKQGIIKPSFKRWEDLGKVWYTADEMDKSLEAYNEASKLATDGKIDFQRAYIYFDRNEWLKVKTAIGSALEKGGLTDKQLGRAWLLTGMAESELGDKYGALKALRSASKYKDSRKNAVQWIEHLEKQIESDNAKAARDKLLSEETEITDS